MLFSTYTSGDSTPDAAPGPRIVVKKLGAESDYESSRVGDTRAYSPDADDDPRSDASTNVFARRIDCWQHTLALCKSSVSPPDRPSRKYSLSPAYVCPRVCERSSIEIYNEDAIDCALRLRALGRDPLVLNLADDDFAGGCVAQGSGAQEDSLFRRTNYCQTLRQSFYPIGPEEAVYSPGVRVLKRGEAADWAPVSEAEGGALAFVACPAIKYPITIREQGERRLDEEDAAALATKIRLVVQVAARNGHDALVLGAMGCGAWNNPARHVAQIFREVLREIDGAVPLFAFAILTTTADSYVLRDPRADHHSSFEVFSDVFAQDSSVAASNR